MSGCVCVRVVNVVDWVGTHQRDAHGLEGEHVHANVHDASMEHCRGQDTVQFALVHDKVGANRNIAKVDVYEQCVQVAARWKRQCL